MEDEILIVPSGAPDSYCRLCFAEANVELLLVPDVFPQPNQTLIGLIKRYVNIRLSVQQDMACSICSTCRMMLEEFDRFRERCLRCDFVLTGEDSSMRKVQEEEIFGEMRIDSISDDVWLGGISLSKDNGVEHGPGDQLGQLENKTCPTCGLVFETSNAMGMHAKNEHGDYPYLYECSQCPSKFKFRSGYLVHLKAHCNELPFRCDSCECGFHTEDVLDAHKIQYHIATTSAERFKCFYCPRVFISDVHLRLHVKSLHDSKVYVNGPPPKRKKASTVTTTEISPEALAVPPLVVIPGKETQAALDSDIIMNAEPASIIQPSTSDNPQSIESTTKPFECATCSIRFHFIGSLKHHMTNAHGQPPNKKGVKRPAKKKTQNTVYAPIAEVPVTEPTVVMPPEAEVFGINVTPPELSAPPAAFSMAAQDAEVFQINVAPHELPTPENFPVAAKEEMDYMPSFDAQIPQIYPCLIYMERLDDRIIPPVRNLEIPLGKFYHTLQKQAQTNIVGDTLDDEMRMNYPRHVQTEHQVFHCQMCLKPFKSRMALSRHKARHKFGVQQCDVCGREFLDKSSLDRHRPVHTNEFPHPCDECVLGFSRPRLLREHKERHHGPNAIPIVLQYCPYCPRAFSKEAQLKIHLKSLHSELTWN